MCVAVCGETMSLIHTWALLLVWIHASAQDRNPETHVTCIVSQECVLPCAFQPAHDERVQWFRQEVLVYSLESPDSSEEEQTAQAEYAGRAFIPPRLVARGNATLILSETRTKDRGKYRCHVRTAGSVHNSHVIVKVEAPIQSLSLELSRLSGYEEIKCTTHDIYPPPGVTWSTVPPVSGSFRPITRKLADKKGMYTIESRLRRLMDQPEIIYICNVTSAYGSQSWTASLREREITAVEGQVLSIPCHAPPYLHSPALSWSFTNGKDAAHILSYDSQSQQSWTSMPWQQRVKVDASRAAAGDGSLRLLDTDHEEDSGTYTCVFSAASQTHTEHTEVFILSSNEKRIQTGELSHWWIVALVMSVLAVALVGMLVYLKVKGTHSKPRKDPEEPIELHLVQDPTESSPLAGEESKKTHGDQPGSPLTSETNK